jgi:hypothetical protein
VKLAASILALMSLGLAPVVATAPSEPAGQPSLQSGTVIEAAERLKPGEYLWAPQIAPEGPVLLVVSLSTQRAVVYRNGVPIGISTASTGRPGYETPTGVFVILQKHVEHYSNIYDSAPMPYMQRLTWGGVALHAGNLPGYPASHGCIRLPSEFARLLYEITHRGMTVIVTERSSVPRVAPADELLAGKVMATIPSITTEWNPGRSPTGPLSLVISAADKRLVVLRNGVVIGSSAIEIDGSIDQTTAYVLNGVVEGKREWVRIGLPGQANKASNSLQGRIRTAEPFRRLVASVLTMGTTVIVTADSLRNGQSGRPLTIIENDKPRLSRW